MLRIVLIEDDPHFAKSVEECLALQPTMRLSLTAPSVESFFANLPPHFKADIILVDVDLPGQSGADAVPALRRRFPNAEVIMLTHSEDSDVMLKAIHNGATGYLNKNFSILQLPQLLRSLTTGGALISPVMARKLIHHFQPSSDTRWVEQLSAKELQVLRLFDQGYSYEEAAAALGISVDGIRYHVKNIYKKLNVNNKIDAIRLTKDKL